MNIAYDPSTEIRLIKGIDVDNSYRNTVYFETIQQQTSYFYNKSEKVFTNFNVIKASPSASNFNFATKKAVRVNCNPSELYNFTYLMYKNTNFYNKWFYAFITSIEWISPNVAEINFEIDLIQTWYFDIEQKDSLIEREHVEDDTRYARRSLEDNITIDVYKSDYPENLTNITGENTYGLILVNSGIIQTEPSVPNDVYTGTIFGTSTGLKAYIVDKSDLIQAVNELNLQEKINGGIVSCSLISTDYMIKDETSNAVVTPGYTIESNDLKIRRIELKQNRNEYLLNYKPRNNILFQYPFTYKQILHPNGKLNIQNELIDDYTTVCLQYFANKENGVTAFIDSYDYQDIYTDGRFYYKPFSDLDISICQGLTDIGNMALNTISTVLSKGFSIPMVGKQSIHTETRSGGTNPLSFGEVDDKPYFTDEQVEEEKMWQHGHKYNYSLTMPKINLPTVPSLTSSFSGNQSDTSFLIYNFNGGTQYLASNLIYRDIVASEHYLEYYDRYFDRYGYRTLRTGKINFKARERWTYVKCSDVNMIINSDVITAKIIKNIFLNGITFWVNGDEIGDYDKSNNAKINRPVEPPEPPEPPEIPEFDRKLGKPLANYVITSQYGNRIHPLTGEVSFHTGVDLDGTGIGSETAPILCMANGEVVEIQNKTTGYGKAVKIKHISPTNELIKGVFYTFYAHLSEINVEVGQNVIKGSVLGKQGSTGSSTASHLHFEVRNSEDNHINPQFDKEMYYE